MGDIPALEIISTAINELCSIPSPPQADGILRSYEESVQNLMEKTCHAINKVSEYAESIVAGLKRLRNALESARETAEKMTREHIEKIIGEDIPTITPIREAHEDYYTLKITPRTQLSRNYRRLDIALVLEKLAVRKQTLSELVLKTEDILNNVNDPESDFMAEVQKLSVGFGDLLSVVVDPDHIMEQEQQRQHEINERRLEELRKNEELRRQKEEEERKRREEERRKEMERQKKNPFTWEPYIYSRGVDSDREAFHGGVCCIVTVMPGIHSEEDFDCEAYEDDGTTDYLDHEEKLVSSITTVTLKGAHGRRRFEVPMRIYLPHIERESDSEQTVIKTLVDEGWWKEQPKFFRVLPTLDEDKKREFIGVDVPEMKKVKIAVIRRPRWQRVTIGQDRSSFEAENNSNIQISFPSNSFSKPTNVYLKISDIGEDNLNWAVNNRRSCEQMVSVSPLVSLKCADSPMRVMEVDFIRKSSDENVYYQLYRTASDTWNVGVNEIRANSVTVKIPPRKNNMQIMELEMYPNVQKRTVIQAADALARHVAASIVRMFVTQKRDNPELVIIQCIKADRVQERLEELEQKGFYLGPDISKEFCVTEGQNLVLRCKGNIGMTAENDGKVKITYHSYLDSSMFETLIHVVDRNKDRGKECYEGALVFETICDASLSRDAVLLPTKGELTLTLPKVRGSFAQQGFAVYRETDYIVGGVTPRHLREYKKL